MNKYLGILDSLVPVIPLSSDIPDLIESPRETFFRNCLKEKIREVVDTLRPREIQILKLRYGIEDNFPRTYKEVGAICNLSNERVRQIESVAIRKLRRPEISKHLKQYLCS